LLTPSRLSKSAGRGAASSRPLLFLAYTTRSNAAARGDSGGVCAGCREAAKTLKMFIQIMFATTLKMLSTAHNLYAKNIYSNTTDMKKLNTKNGALRSKAESASSTEQLETKFWQTFYPTITRIHAENEADTRLKRHKRLEA
jgi:hypothetical protein